MAEAADLTLSTPGGRAPVTAMVWTTGASDVWLAPLVRLLELPEVTSIVVCGPQRAELDRLAVDPRIETRVETAFSAALPAVAATSAGSLLVLTSPVMVPAVGFEPSLDILEGDLRVAAVCFLSNAAGHLSFPFRNRPRPYAIEGHDETTLTRRLRTTGPELLPVTLMATAGAATLLSADCVRLATPDPEFDQNPEVSIAELALRVSRRGMRAVLDPSTYVTRLWDGGTGEAQPLKRPAVRRALNSRHPFFPGMFDRAAAGAESPLGLTLRTARAKIQGLRVLIEASSLGPIENGTQVQTMSLIEALARRDDVAWVGVGVGGEIPRYAERLLTQSKIELVRSTDLKFQKMARVDILHRPFQPPSGLPWKNWRRLADRVVITVQDLIAYSIGAYHFDTEAWVRSRRGIVQGSRQADGIVVISHDVADDMVRERLPVPAERLFVVENGTDHLRGDEPDSIPAELLARGWASREFLVVLGATYSHKNRDLAIRAFRVLRETRPGLGLVLAGVSVAAGSSRALEAAELVADSDGVLTLPDVTSQERNWLLRHAAVNLYPTSAEGFGLVPFEAARFGTPTAFARFGPLAEVLPDVPVAATSWSPEALAGACEALLADPEVAAAQVKATLANGTAYTWDRTAENLVSTYRQLLAQPER